VGSRFRLSSRRLLGHSRSTVRPYWSRLVNRCKVANGSSGLGPISCSRNPAAGDERERWHSVGGRNSMSAWEAPAMRPSFA
jgi:hypothetical protein